MAVAVLGKKTDEKHDKLVKEMDELETFYLQNLTPIFQRAVNHHKLYLADRKDQRLAHEKWRSWSWIPDPYQLTETKTAALKDILNTIDPPVQAEGVGREDAARARGFERTLDYVFRGNSWGYAQEMLLRECGIQGFSVIKPGWREKSFTTTRRPSRDERKAFDVAVNVAMQQGVPSPPDPESQPDEFKVWLESAQKVAPNIPSLDLKNEDTVQYRGPWFSRPSIFDLRFDLLVEDWTEMDVVFHRIVKPWKWVQSMAGPDADKPFDEEQVNLGKSGASGSGGEQRRLTTQEADIAAKFGISLNLSDPLYKDAVELLEVWRPKSDLPHLVILNRETVINKRPDVHPYWHRQLPFVPIRNIPLGRRAVGMGDYYQLDRTFADRNTLRDLMIDALVLSVMPVFLKSRSLGMPDAQKFLSPGSILDVNDVGGWKRGWESPAGFNELAQVLQMLLEDENNTHATWSNVRGAQASIGRVSATESESRLKQGLVRMKQAAIRIEEEHNPIIPQALMLMYQKWPDSDADLAQLRQKIVGTDEQDPLAGMTRDDFAESLGMDIKFRGATRTLNRELQAQQLKDFLQTATAIQTAPGVSALCPSEVRAILRRLVEANGQKGIQQIITTEGDALQDEAYKVVKQSVALQLMQGQQAIEAITNPAPPPGPKPPSESLNYKDAPQAGLQPSQMPPPAPTASEPPVAA